MSNARAVSVAVLAVLTVVFLAVILSGPQRDGAAEVFDRIPASLSQAYDLTNYAEPNSQGLTVPNRPVPPDSGVFRVPESLRPRVDFWKWIYTSVYSYQVVIHDNRDLETIYGIVDLNDESDRKLNNYQAIRKALDKVLSRYRGHIRYLTTATFAFSSLRGERRRLYLLMQANGGIAAFKGKDKTMRAQRGLRDTFRDSIIRSGRYVSAYRAIFRKEGLPEELSLLPHLESSFMFKARSNAGAVGIWQLTSIATRRILHISSTVDERLDPWRSAEAAAQIMADNYRRFKSWPLAITAYNQGAGSISRAIRATGSKKIAVIIDRYRGRTFGFAGRNFYSAFLATLEVLRNYENYYGALPIKPTLLVKRHTLKEASPLKAICDELGIEPKSLVAMNPALKSRAYTTSTRLPRGLVINLPVDSGSTRLD